MKNITEAQKELKIELETKVHNWVNGTFNMIQLDVYNIVLEHGGGSLIDEIRQSSIEELALDYAYDQDVNELFYKYFEQELCDEVDSNHARKLSRKLGNIIKDYKELDGSENELFEDLDMFNFIEFAHGEFEDETREFIYQTFYTENEEGFKTFLAESYEDEIRERQDENYPMWNTLFEFKDEPSEDWINKAEASGYGVIESTEHFNTTLFASGCGYSFYGAHWIPMYLSFFSHEAEKYEGIYYGDL